MPSPANAQEFSDQIIFYGGFLDGFEYLTSHLRSSSMASKTLVIRGNPGSGKKSLINKVEELNLPQSTVVHINPYHHSDDYSTLRHIALKCGLKIQPSLHDVIMDIAKSDDHIVIVLHDFEIFCRQKQSLLYCLTDLTQSGHNVCLIGLTISLDCTVNIEKRVRSRLNTIYYELSPPYRSKKEYCEFASLLLGGIELGGYLKQQLEMMYLTNNRSVRCLKRYLIDLCEWDDEGRFDVYQPPASQAIEVHGDQSDVKALEERLGWLTKPQLELLKIAVCYCCLDEPVTEFTMQNLEEYTRFRGYYQFDATSPLAYRNIKVLCKISLLKALKQDQVISQFSKFTIGVLPTQLRYVLELRPEYHSLKTDPLWRKLF